MRKWMRVGAAAGWLLMAVLGQEWARAQVATTTVQDTVTDASGAAASGTVVVSWNAFTTAAGSSVAAGSLTATLGTGGALNVALQPNAGATPMGSYYTAVFHLSDGTVSREFWVVPVSVPGGGAAKLAGIRNQVLPASLAMQTVSKQYVDTTVAKAMAGVAPGGSLPYVLKAGDAMLGPLALPANPTLPLQAATKQYVDTAVSGTTASGPAGGDLSGSYPNPTVTGLHAVSGTVDGTAIGATTASTGRFSSVKLAGAANPVAMTASSSGSGDFAMLSNGGTSSKLQLQLFGGYYSGLVFGTPSDSGAILYASDGMAFYVGSSELQKASAFGYRIDVPLDVHGTGASLCATGVYLCVNETLFTVDSSGNVAALGYHETLRTPASSSATCAAGDFTDDANYHYVCVAANTWKRVALSGF